MARFYVNVITTVETIVEVEADSDLRAILEAEKLDPSSTIVDQAKRGWFVAAGPLKAVN